MKKKYWGVFVGEEIVVQRPGYGEPTYPEIYLSKRTVESIARDLRVEGKKATVAEVRIERVGNDKED